MGANIYPQDVEYGLYPGNAQSPPLIESFCLPARGAAASWSRGRWCTCSCAPAAALGADEREGVAARLRAGLVDHLRSASRDFAESLAEDPSAAELRVRAARPRHRPVRRRGPEDQERLRDDRDRHEDGRPQQAAPVRPGQRRLHRRRASTPALARAAPAHAEVVPAAPAARRPRRASAGIYVYYKFPFTFGQVVLFETMDQLLRFARNKLHRELMALDHRTRRRRGANANAGFIRLYEAVPGRRLRQRRLERRGRRGLRRALLAR